MICQKETGGASAPKSATDGPKPAVVRREPVKPKIPVAEKTPRQKRQAEKAPPAPTPPPADEDKRWVAIAEISVVDPNTLNLDPDPGFWLNLDPDPGLYYQF